MKATELRVNSWYKSVKWGKPVILELSDLMELYERSDGAYNDPPIDEMFEPIPLDEEWLLRIDKNPITKEWKGNGQDYQPETSKTKQVVYEIIISAIDVVYQEWSYRALETDNWITEKSYFLDYYDDTITLYRYELHVLQNLISALTGNELTINNK
jgi:hypothetical protein